MGRSVSYPSGAVVAFKDVSYIEESYEWDDFIEDITNTAQSKWPSLHACSKWLDREDKVILESQQIYIGVSEYCGLAAIWMIPIEREEVSHCNAYATGNFKRMAKKFLDTFGEYHKLGNMSNGEGVYERINKELKA